MRLKNSNSLIYILFFGFLASVSVLCFANDVDTLVQKLLVAQQKNEKLPNTSKGLSMSDAYDIQQKFIKERLKSDQIVGFKAGLTTEAAQASLNINRPIFGVLLKSGDFSKNPAISLKHYHHLTVEIELGFITNQPIKKTVQSVEELKRYIERIVPVIEMPDLGFENATFNAIDLVAGNTGFAGYITDLNPNWISHDINSLSVTLLHNGAVVSQGQGSDALGDQWEALRWLVNQVLAHGWTIDKGNLFITGALGEILLAQPGTYRAQFNNEASIEFTIAE